MAHIGILALQGGFEAHQKALQRLGVSVSLVRLPRDLDSLDGLILPGGESTTQIRLLKRYHLWERVEQFYREGGTLWGTCAGTILLARKVTPQNQPSFGFLDITVERNSYGSQKDSFEVELSCSLWGQPFPGVFIRAPRVVDWNRETVKVLCFHKDDPVLLQGERVLASTFHPELTSDLRLHEWFLQLVGSREKAC